MLRRNGDIRFHHFKDEEVVYIDLRASSCSRHSKQAWHSRISGASTLCALSGVSANSRNLSISAPEVLPIPTTTSVSAVVGRLMTHSPLLRIIWKLYSSVLSVVSCFASGFHKTIDSIFHETFDTILIYHTPVGPYLKLPIRDNCRPHRGHFECTMTDSGKHV